MNRATTSFWRENLSLKLVSLILAILLEVYFYSPDNSLTITLPASIVIKNVPASMVFVAPRHGERGIPARIALRGPRPLIERLRTVPQQFTVEYPSGSPTVFPVNVDKRQLSLPAGIELIEVEPDNLTVELDRLVTRELPLEPHLEGTLPAGYYLESSIVRPRSISISGPAKDVDHLKGLLTEKITLADATEPILREVSIAFPPSSVRVEPEVASVRLEIKPIPAERVFDKVTVRLRAPEGFAGTVEPTKVRATVIGPKEQLDGLPSVGVELRPTIEGLGEGRHEVSLVADLPEGVRLFATEPKSVVVTLVRQTPAK